MALNIKTLNFLYKYVFIKKLIRQGHFKKINEIMTLAALFIDLTFYATSISNVA